MEPPKAAAAQPRRIPNGTTPCTNSNNKKHAGGAATSLPARMKMHGMLVVAALLSLGGYTTLFFLHLDPHLHGGTDAITNGNGNERSLKSNHEAPPIATMNCSEQVRKGQEETKIHMDHQYKLREEKRQREKAKESNAGAVERALALQQPMSNHQTNNRTRTVFALDRAKFVEDVAVCIQEAGCHVFYHHVQKTGGWFLASTLHPVLNGGEHYNDRVWCCDLDFVKRFRQNSTYFCDLKLSVLEVHGDHVQEIVDTCQQQYSAAAMSNNNHSSSGAERAIVVQTVRDPVERVISWIHQLCNKMLRDIAPALQEACRRCSYHNDTELWDDFVQNQINIYQKLLYAVPVPVYTIENVMIDPMLALLEARLGLKFPKGYRNLEGKKNVCDFHLPSALLKRFQDNRMVYRQLLTGISAGENTQQQA